MIFFQYQSRKEQIEYVTSTVFRNNLEPNSIVSALAVPRRKSEQFGEILGEFVRNNATEKDLSLLTPRYFIIIHIGGGGSEAPRNFKGNTVIGQ